MKKRILTIVSAFALCGALAVAAIPRSAGAEEKSRLFRFGFAAEVSLESPAGTVEFTAENDAGIVYAFGGDTLTVTAKDAAGKTHEVTATAAKAFRWISGGRAPPIRRRSTEQNTR